MAAAIEAGVEAGLDIFSLRARSFALSASAAECRRLIKLSFAGSAGDPGVWTVAPVPFGVRSRHSHDLPSTSR